MSKNFYTQYMFVFTLLALVLGSLLGHFSHDISNSLAVVGKLFITLLKMVVLPLTLASVISSIVGLGGPGPLKKMGIRVFLWYTFTTGLAVIVGLIVALNVDMASSYSANIATNYDPGNKIQSLTVEGMILSFFPSNIFSSLSDFSMAQVVSFALIFGIAALFVGEENRKLIHSFSQAINDVMFKVAHTVILMTPFGVLSLMAQVITKMEMTSNMPLSDLFISLGKYVFTVFIMLILYVFTVHAALLKIFVKKISLVKHYSVMKKQMLMAFSSSSSLATLPVTMECAEELKISKEVRDFTLPLGATANMSGTAMYMMMVVVFIGQLNGHHFTLNEMIIVVFTIIALSVGVSGTPGASLTAVLIVLTTLNLPVEYMAIPLAVDRFLDMTRTITNVHDDIVVARILDAQENKSQN